MPPRHAVFSLPPELRAKLDKRIIDAGFGQYLEHSAWLKSLGFDISKSALHNYACKLKEAIEGARALPKAETQMEATKRALVFRLPVDPVTCAERDRIFRLSAIVHRLRCKGWPILAERDHGDGIARYRLPVDWSPPDWKPPGKRKPRGSIQPARLPDHRQTKL